MALHPDAPRKGDALLKAAGLYKTPQERQQREERLREDMRRDIETTLREMGTYGADLGLQAAQQITRRHTKATSELHENPDTRVTP